MMKNIIIGFLFVLVPTVNFNAQDSTEKRIQLLLDEVLRKHPNAVGIILHIEAPGKKFSWGGATGYCNRETQEPIQADQAGRIASVTKTFVAATILRLVELGQISVDQPIKELLPERTELLLTNSNYSTDSITVGHLLSHKSGMPSTATPKYREKEKNDLFYRWTRDEKIRDAIQMMEKGQPGRSFFYSDLNYLLLSEIIEQVTHTSFYLAMRDLLDYEKIGLKHTWFYTLEQEPKGTKPRFYQYKESRDWANSNDESITWGLYGPMGLVSTAEDMANFSKALFSRSVFDKQETLDLMLSDIKTMDGVETEGVYYDLYTSNYYMGIEHTVIDNTEVYGHTGYWGSWMGYFPKENVHFGLFVLNGDALNGFEIELVREVLNIISEQ